jgi:hypothetical protein
MHQSGKSVGLGDVATFTQALAAMFTTAVLACVEDPALPATTGELGIGHNFTFGGGGWVDDDRCRSEGRRVVANASIRAS